MKSARSRWVLTLLRYGLCAAAIAYLVTHVPWNDHAKLNDAQQTRVRLIEQRQGAFVILQDGQQRTMTAADVHHIDVKGQMVPEIEYGIPSVVLQTRKVWAFWAVLLFLPVPLLAALRLTLMLAVQKVRLPLWSAVKLTFAGNFFNFALPGMTGGDLIKAYYVTRFTSRKTEAVTTVFLDRAVGLSSLVLMAGAMIIFTRDPSEFGGQAVMLAAICAALAVGGAVVFSRRIRRALRLGDLVARLPLSHQLRRIGEATLAMRRHKSLVLLSLLITFGLQTIVIVSATVMAWALQMSGGFAYFFIGVAIGFLIAAVPISPPQAIGVMEFLFVQFFTLDGANTASQAVALALAVRLIQLIWSLPGVLVPLLGAHLPNRAALRELEELEKDGQERPGPAQPELRGNRAGDQGWGASASRR